MCLEGWADIVRWFGQFGGAEVGSLCMHVAHGGCFGVRAVLLDLFGCEVWPGVKETGGNCVSPSGDDWREKSGVVESNAVAKMG